jgi:hypothetical protein
LIANDAGHGLQSLSGIQYDLSLVACDQHSTALDCLRNRFLVASQSVRDLLLCAKQLFVAAMVVAIAPRGLKNEQSELFSPEF